MNKNIAGFMSIEVEEYQKGLIQDAQRVLNDLPFCNGDNYRDNLVLILTYLQDALDMHLAPDENVKNDIVNRYI